ncbi:MAG TPA: DNA mismatch repair protein MutS, partial [Chloroflexota bacterium]|nr:DNA mismatch repair protein MutS [Chloroflexota bacterium]
AQLVARELQITLTSRPMAKGVRVPMAGVPHHAVDSYIARLIARGHKVAMAEQLGEPGAKMMERDVLRVLTPGTVLEPELLPGERNNYLLAVVPSAAGSETYGLAYIDATTGEFAATQLVGAAALQRELDRVDPAEVLLPAAASESLRAFASERPLSPGEAWLFDADNCRDTLKRQFDAAALDGFGLEERPLALCAAGALLHYLGQTRKAAGGERLALTELRTYSSDGFMTLDQYSRRNLELTRTARGERQGSLLDALDRTRTPMGARLLAHWLAMPLLDVTELTQRQELIQGFVESGIASVEIGRLLGRLPDLERLANRCLQRIASPRDLAALRGALDLLPNLALALSVSHAAVADGRPAPTAAEGVAASADSLAGLAAKLRTFPDVVALLNLALVDEPPASLADGGVIRAGYAPELDQLLDGGKEARTYIAGLEAAERERTGIRGLKVGYNKVFGYYIEVSRSNADTVPGDYQRKQTLTTGERYITPQLKEYEAIVLNAQEQRVALETQLFERVREEVAQWAPGIVACARTVALVDVVRGLAELAVERRWCCPTLDRGGVIDIRGGRHPVVELSLPAGEFVANDCHLDRDECQLVLLTGPNMAGKSTYLRQVALIVLMAQVGSFVPAQSARIGLVDRIFTRVGAQDDLASGQSTFMVEMIETSLILQSSSPRSLIILDEVGRGTSTYDGLAIAQAVVEYIHNHPACGAKTLFATHYHELTALEEQLPRVRNFRMDVLEEQGRVVFLRKVVPGGADKSYGIYVARLAGAPRAVIRRAEELLEQLQAGHPTSAAPAPAPAQTDHDSRQLALFSADDALRQDLSKLDPLNMTPLEALNALYELKRKYPA